MWFYLILFIESLFAGIVNALGLQPVTTLPTIMGVDVDAILSQGMGLAHTFFDVFWPIYYMYLGALVIVAYEGLKVSLRFFMGHRAPGR